MGDMVGGCLCGRTRYRISAPALFTAACHCSHCQKQSGGAFSVNLGVPRESLTLEGAPLSVYRDTGESGLAVVRKFCGNCGSPIVSELEAAPAISFVKAGTLDDVSGVKPQLDIWCDHAQPWVHLGADTQHVPRNPPL
jgi:hypothetical protein